MGAMLQPTLPLPQKRLARRNLLVKGWFDAFVLRSGRWK
jgi:hypothetical protein